jgi:hypothetical protein
MNNYSNVECLKTHGNVKMAEKIKIQTMSMIMCGMPIQRLLWQTHPATAAWKIESNRNFWRI